MNETLNFTKYVLNIADLNLKTSLTTEYVQLHLTLLMNVVLMSEVKYCNSCFW